MSTALEPGMWVECIRTAPSDRNITMGSVYCVDGIKAQPMSCGHCRTLGLVCDRTGVSLAGVRVGKAARFWCSRAFRPIDRRTTELFRSLLTPAPERERETA